MALVLPAGHTCPAAHGPEQELVVTPVLEPYRPAVHALQAAPPGPHCPMGHGISDDVALGLLVAVTVELVLGDSVAVSELDGDVEVVGDASADGLVDGVTDIVSDTE